MAEVKIIFWSGTGNTAAMAEMIAKGVTEAGADPVIIPFENITPDSLADDPASTLR